MYYKQIMMGNKAMQIYIVHKDVSVVYIYTTFLKIGLSISLATLSLHLNISITIWKDKNIARNIIANKHVLIVFFLSKSSTKGNNPLCFRK